MDRSDRSNQFRITALPDLPQIHAYRADRYIRTLCDAPTHRIEMAFLAIPPFLMQKLSEARSRLELLQSLKICCVFIVTPTSLSTTYRRVWTFLPSS